MKWIVIFKASFARPWGSGGQQQEGQQQNRDNRQDGGNQGGEMRREFV
jgi:hypothetical protein